MTSLQDSRYLGGVNELTVITTIREGRVPGSTLTYLQQLEAVLDSIANREKRGIPTPIRLIATIHFARWIIWQDGERYRLIFTSNYDGSMWQYLRDFAALIASDMDRVWGNCDGYPAGGCKDFDAFWQYVGDHQVQTTGFFAALPRETLHRQEALLDFRAAYDAFLRDNLAQPVTDYQGFYERFCQFVRDTQSFQR